MRTWVAAIALLAAAGLTAACGDDESTEPAPAPTTSQQPSTSDGPAPRGGPDVAEGCGQRALEQGEFNADCKEYQGYLDPGGAGRDDTAGEAQLEYACEHGYIPEEQC
ncbi:hypothetical protein BJF85_16340 [Saccharomonospora sp. CUA-673]|uniref:hypothetical protein n=1 Tax=Saccharomonospora sp. CUA-673 TaxID=1904969 RepID=UPI00096401CF|nr:hypothetical protein [Saccharomonospora sp. CUA-673]OLT46604.1 hypothetical protein BJF85_16340 [Saccharomonospora sp. CUA-673]